MKNVLKALGGITVFFGIIISFIACDNGNDTTHIHQWGNWSVTKAATCTTEGIETRIGILPIDPTAHAWEDWTQTTLPTCTEAGIKTRICTYDHSHIDPQTQVGDSALGHDWDWNVTTPASLLMAGLETGICQRTNCSETNIRIIPSLISQSLETQIGTQTSPAELTLNIDLDNMTTEGSNWMKLLDIITEANKYVVLDLSDCTGIIEFDPGTANTGEKMIVSLVLPNTAISIARRENLNSTFKNFTVLKEITGLNIANIGANAFYNCTALIKVNFPATTYMGWAAFRDCSNLKELNFPTLDYISGNSFQRCTSLIEVDFPKVAYIGGQTFDDCIALIKANFPATTNIDFNPFDGCTSLTNFIITGIGSLSTIENGKALVLNNTELLAYPTASGVITMDSITIIGQGAFIDCQSLIEVSFPSVTKIKNWAFINLRSLCKVTLGSITEENFDTSYPFTGNLRDVYFDVGGGAGTYTTLNPGYLTTTVWTKQ